MRRRSFIALAGGLALTLAGCAPAGGGEAVTGSGVGGSDAATAGAAVVKDGGEIYYTAVQLPGSWQQQSASSHHKAQVWSLLVERLFYYDGDGRLTGHLATGWTANDDFTTFRIQIRPGVTFSNGESLDADVVAANLNLLALGDESKGIARASRFPKSYVEAKPVGDLEVEVSLSEPYPSFIEILGSWVTVGIVAKETLEGDATFQSDLNNVYGTGAFVLDSYDPEKQIILTKREDYDWARPDANHEGAAYIDKVTVNVIAEDSLRVGALTSGQTDIIHYIPIDEEQRLQDEGYTVINVPILSTAYNLTFRLTAKYVDDIRVRQALTHATNRDEIIARFASGWEKPISIFNDSVYGTVDLSDKFEYDPDLADSLLDEAGWTERDSEGYRVKDGERLSLFTYPSIHRVYPEQDLQLVAQQWKAVGVELKILKADASNYSTLTAADDVPIGSQHNATGSPTELVTYVTNTGSNTYRHNDAELELLLTDLLNTSTNDEARAEASRQVQERLLDEALVIPLHQDHSTWGASTRLKDVSADQQGVIDLYDAWVEE